jgi:hypothetical protein
VGLVSELLSVIDMYAADDVHAVAEPHLLVEAEMLLEARCRLDAAIARRLQALDVRDVTVSECGRQTRSWLVEEQHLSGKDAGRLMWIARRLPAYPAVADAFGTGQINAEHVRVILGCLLRLPTDWREAAEAELLAFAIEHDPGMLAMLCRELRVRSGADEDAEAAAERRYAARYLSVNPTWDGMVHLDGMLDPESAATMAAAITPLIGAGGSEDERSAGQCRADALVELARFSLDHGDLPDHGGERPQVVVTIPFNELRDRIAARELGHATLGGQPLTASAARRLACDADIIPAVLGADSEVLDLGRSTPTWSRAQRRARRLEDKGCTWPACQAPLSRCRIHHMRFWWAHHGPTDKSNGTHVCPFHHWLVHHTSWKIYRNSEGKIEVRRT